MSLSERLRDCEAAPWVIEEIKELEAENKKFETALLDIANTTDSDFIGKWVSEYDLRDIAREALR